MQEDAGWAQSRPRMAQRATGPSEIAEGRRFDSAPDTHEVFTFGEAIFTFGLTSARTCPWWSLRLTAACGRVLVGRALLTPWNCGLAPGRGWVTG